MKYLITGGAGFIGSNTAKVLLKEGHEIIVLDIRKDLGSIRNIRDDITYYNVDIRNFEKVRKIIKNVDGIIHLAAVSRVIWGHERPKECVDINVNGISNVLEAARLSRDRPWVIFGSSREVYGEPDELPVSENAPYKVANIYGRTKMDGELMCKHYSNNYDLRTGVLRFSNVYGGVFDILDRVIPRFILNSLKNKEINLHGGNQIFDFTHIDDTVNGIVKMSELLSNTHGQYYDTFHFLTGIGTTLQEVVDIISNIMRERPRTIYSPPRDYDVERFIGDPQKARRLLGFRATILAEEGINQTFHLYKGEFTL